MDTDMVLEFMVRSSNNSNWEDSVACNSNRVDLVVSNNSKQVTETADFWEEVEGYSVVCWTLYSVDATQNRDVNQD